MGVEPWQVAKISGIGCSSKTPAYFLGQSHGFNAVHGRAPAIATGAAARQPQPHCIVVSGDGDTASIGIGQFMHMLRRNMPLIYIIENNGVYGLTKGQFSATADVGAKLKTGIVNELHADRLLPGGHRARRHLRGPLVLRRQAPVVGHPEGLHRRTTGLSVIDVVSPCTTFNDHEGSTKSYAYMKDHEEPLHELDFVPFYEDIQVDFEEGTRAKWSSTTARDLLLKKLGRDYDPTDKMHAIGVLHAAAQSKEVLTGILYVDRSRPTFTEMLNMVPEALATLPQARTRPSAEDLAMVVDEFR